MVVSLPGFPFNDFHRACARMCAGPQLEVKLDVFTRSLSVAGLRVSRKIFALGFWRFSDAKGVHVHLSLIQRKCSLLIDISDFPLSLATLCACELRKKPQRSPWGPGVALLSESISFLPPPPLFLPGCCMRRQSSRNVSHKLAT